MNHAVVPDATSIPAMVSHLAGTEVSALALVCAVGEGAHASVAAFITPGAHCLASFRNAIVKEGDYSDTLLSFDDNPPPYYGESTLDIDLSTAAGVIGVDLNNDKKAWGEKFGMTHFINPNDVENVVDHIVQLTDGGADYSFECIGNTKVMRQALECTHKGWGQSVIIGVAEAGAEISTRPFQLVTGRVWKGSAFGGARGRTDVPKIVDWYMDGKLNIDDLITHKLPLSRINEGFDLMKRGESIRTVVEF